MPLSARALAGLKSYQYVATGYTWLDDAHQPAWNWVVARLPLWLAPNLITLTGTLCVAAAYAANIAYNPGFTGEAPAWVQWATALAVFLYVNLDCLDGKQARRTGSSSPLGQLFDHGCDALTLHMLLANIAAALGVGCSWKMAAGCMGIMLPWILAQWEEYHTGIMVYGTRFYGVLEANYSICAVHVASAVAGPGLWRVPLPLGGGHAVTVADAALAVVSAAGVGQAVHSAQRVWRAYTRGPQGTAHSAPPPASPATTSGTPDLLSSPPAPPAGPPTTAPPPHPPHPRGHKQLGLPAAALHLAGLLLTLALGAWTVAWGGSAPAPAGGAPTGYHSDATRASLAAGHVYGAAAVAPDAAVCDARSCRTAFSMFGLLYALTASQLILAHMAKEPWAPSVVALAAPLLHAAAVSGLLGGGSGAQGGGGGVRWVLQLGGGRGGRELAVDAVSALHAITALAYAHYVLTAISLICDHLGIACLRIPAPPPAARMRRG